jgi:ElaB/YqjD/DUF883 family membrane-anchored ribosome-binding protein
VTDPRDDRDVNDSDPEILRAEADIARTRQAVASSVMALQQEISRAFDWREWVRRRPVEAVAVAFGVGALLGLVRPNSHRGRK